jgi:hypothetical protein
MFPTFTLKSNSPDTISFVNIPLAFDGWQLYARFENADGYVDTAKAGVEVVSYADAYAPVFEEYDKYLSMPYEERRNGHEFVYFRSLTYRVDQCDSYPYALIDLDNNGIKELLFGGGIDGVSGIEGVDRISVAYTLVSAKPVEIFHTWENRECFLLNDNSILEYGRNPGTEVFYFVGNISETEFIWSYGIWIASWEGEYYYSSDGAWGKAGDKIISREEFNEIFSQYKSRIVDIPYNIHYIN